MAKFIDTTPKPSFLRAMANQKWTAAGALSELVDNALGAIRGNAKHCRIIHDTSNRILTILDDGQGMDAVGRLFQLGNTIGLSPKDIGIYGSGGTLAILWLPSIVEVWSLRDGQVSSFRMPWSNQFGSDHFFQVPNAWEPATTRNTPHELFDLGHGTMIKMHLRRERSIVASNVIRDLSETYAPAIRNGKILTWQTISKGKLMEARPLVDLFEAPGDDSKRVIFSGVVEIGDKHLPFSGCVGLIDGLPHSKSTISIGFLHRTIFKTRDCYQSSDGNERFHGTGITGWIDLGEGWQPYLSTTKDEINDGPARAALMQHIFQNIHHLLKQTEADERKLLLDDLALNLQAGLSALSTLHVDVPHDAIVVTVKDDEPGPEPGPGPNPNPGPNPQPHEPEIIPSDDLGDKINKQEQALSEIIITQASNEAMDGALCRVEIDRGGVIATVNQDHELVTQALISRPINRSLLSWMIARELARAIIEDNKLIKNVFRSKSVIKRIETLRDDSARERFIARLLIDCVRQPQITEAA